MEFRKRLSLILTLIIFILSIKTPFGSSFKFFQADEVYPSEANLECVQSRLPVNSVALLLSDSDGTFQWGDDTEMLMRMQYQIVPSLVVTHQSPDFDINQYDWFIAYTLNDEQTSFFARKNGLEVVQECGHSIVLRRIEKP